MRHKLTRVGRHLQEKLKDPYFRELYELEAEKGKIAELIVRYRVKKGLTQAKLARKLKISQQQISEIENGDFSSLLTIQKILLTLGYHIVIKAAPLEKRLKPRLQLA